MKIPNKLLMLVLSIILIVTGVLHLVPIVHVPANGNILALVAIVTGVLLLRER